MRTKRNWMAALLGVFVTLAAHAQSTVNVSGHITNEVGQAIPNSTVEFSTDGGRTAKYTFTADPNGDYKGAVAPDDYTITLVPSTVAATGKNMSSPSQGKEGEKKMLDRIEHQKVAGEATINFDLSRQEYIDKLAPERKKQIEEYKAKNAEASKENAQIKNLNGLLQQSRDAIKAGQFDTAITNMQQAIQQRPTEGILYVTLGDAQLGAKKWDDAAGSYNKAIDLIKALPKQDEKTIGAQAAAYNNLGQALVNTNKPEDAANAYEQAAKIEPAKAGMYYGNEAVVFWKQGKMDQAATAADKAIAADPAKPIPYYVKGQALIQKAGVDKSGKIVLPPGCADAYQKFLELQPTGPQADEVKSVLQSAGEPIKSSYRAGKKS